MNQFEAFRQRNLPEFNKYLHDQIVSDVKLKELQDGMLYSVDAGGKRLRPFLMLAAIQSLNENISINKYFKIAGSLELVHTYSLIHDDLPEMDNDDFRRGKLTNHKKFTPARAVLAGDGLLTQAFYWLTDNDLSAGHQTELVRELALKSGPEGMVRGQMIDIVNTGKKLSLNQIKDLDLGKTGALFEASIQMGAICVDASANIKQSLTNFSKKFGIAFQIYDDLLDLTSTKEIVGKEVNKDIKAGKNSYPELLGIDNAQDQLRELIASAENDLKNVNLDKSILADSLAYFKLGD